MRCCRRTEETAEEEKTNKQINKSLNEIKRVRRCNILMLGAGDAGKSTFIRQLRVIHSDGISQPERQRFTHVLRDNCLSALQKIINAASDFSIPISEESIPLCSLILSSTELSPDLASKISNWWNTSPFIEKVLRFHQKIQIPGGISGIRYFIENIERFADPNFEPTDEDISRAKLRTTGVMEVVVHLKGSMNSKNLGEEFNLIDVGGQRSERRKWLHCFSIVNAVIFMVALNEYDMVLEEDGTTNRLWESLKLFQLLTGTKYLHDKPWILFLNKSDLFLTEIDTVPIESHFPEYTTFQKTLDGSNFEKGTEFIKSLFTNHFSASKLYAFITCALDRKECENVFKVVRREILESALDLAGL